MKKKVIFLTLIFVSLVIGITILIRNKSITKNASNNDIPEEFKETVDYYREDVCKLKPEDFESETKDLLLSSLIENISVVKLDNENKEALLNGRSFPYITESYIGMNSDDLPYKLYDKATGKFLRNIGNIGQGPAEYPFISDAVIDEKNDRIYITCSQMKHGILEYNIHGDFLGKIDISFINDRKIKFTVNDSIITAFIMTFDGDKYGVVSFDKKGNLISSAPAKVFMEGNYDLEVFIETNTPSTGYSHVASTVYYNYDSSKHELIPAFAIERGKFPYVHIHELNHFYLLSINILNKEKRRFISDHTVLYNKKEKKGYPVRLINDFLGGIPFRADCFDNGMYIDKMNASDFREKAKEALKRNKLTNEKKKFLSDLVDSMTDDDNDIIFYSILKE